MVLLSLKDKHIQQEPCKPERSLQCQAITGDFIALENYASAYYSKLLFTFILSPLAFLMIYVFQTVLLTVKLYKKKKKILDRCQEVLPLTSVRTFTKQDTWKGNH